MFAREKIRRVLIYRLGSLGDTCVAIPAFRLVRDAFPGAHITLLTSKPIFAKSIAPTTILDGTGLIDDMLDYPNGIRSPKEVLRLRKSIVDGKFDCLIYMQEPKGGKVTSIRDLLFFLSCGLYRHVGIPFKKHELFFLENPKTGLYRNVTEHLLDRLHKLGSVDLRDDRTWDLRLSEAEYQEADRLLGGTGPFIAFSVGTKLDVKDWTEPNWEALTQQLSARYPGLGLVALGANHDRERSDKMLDLWNGPKVNLCGDTESRISAAVLSRAVFFLGHDSGPMHLAAGVGTPCVAIFSAHSLPGKWFPRGQHNRVIFHKTECFGCALSTCVKHGKKCIMSVTVDEVLKEISELMDSKAAGLPIKV